MADLSPGELPSVHWRFAMVSPHLLRSVDESAAVGADDRVLVLAVLGGRYLGPTVQTHVRSLVRRVAALAPAVEIVVFIDEAVASPRGLLGAMIAALRGSAADGVVRAAEVTEAVKRVEDGVVLGGVDRSRLVGVRSPEVFRRQALERAISAAGTVTWAGVTDLVVRSGGTVVLFDEMPAGRVADGITPGGGGGGRRR